MRSATLLAGLVFILAIRSLATPHVVLDPGATRDRALAFAAGEVARAGGGQVAYDAVARAGDVAIGRSSRAVRALSPPLDRPLRAEGFAIRRVGGVVTVTGADDRGDVYGALWLAERIRLDPRFLEHPDCVREPALRYRELVDGQDYVRPPGRGYEGWLQECLKLGVNTVMYSAITREEARLSKAYGFWLMGGTAPFSNLPVEDLIARYGSEVSEFPGQLCPLKPRVWEAQRADLRAMLDRYPEIDFVRASMGDIPEDYHVWDCHGPACARMPKSEGSLRACQATWDVVVGERHKTFFISSWGNPPEKYPLNLPASYRRIMNALPDHGVVSTINNTQHDFYLSSPTNPLIGQTSRPQDLYFEVTAEYGGAGFLPVYTGPQIAQRTARAVRTGHAVGITGRLWEGVGLWTRDVLWTRANLYALSRAGWEPQGDSRAWVRDWAALTFGPGGSEELADALMLSQELARRTFWVPGFSGEKGPAYAITRRNVITDGTHYLRWAKFPHLAAYRQCHVRDKLRQALASTDGALRLRDRMMARWRASKAKMRDAKLAAACDRDFRHFSAVVDVLIPYQRALLNWCHTQDAGIPTTKRCGSAREAVRWARVTRSAWARYRAHFNLYRDGGMSEMLADYERDCAAIAAREPVVAVSPEAAANITVSVFNNAWRSGLRGRVVAALPAGWSGDRERAVYVAFGERRTVSIRVATPASEPEGDATVPVSLVDSGGRVLERASIRVVAIRLGVDRPSSARHAEPRAMDKRRPARHAEPRAKHPPHQRADVASAETGSARNATDGDVGGRGGSFAALRMTAAGRTMTAAAPRTVAARTMTAPRAHPTTVCPHIAHPPAIDGVLKPGEWPADHAAWAQWPVRINASTKGNTYAIAARWAWDDRCLYVAFEVADDVETPLGVRDTIYRADREHIVLDLDGDRRDDYEVAFVRAPDAFLAWPVTVEGVFTSTQVAYRAKVARAAHGIVVACRPRHGGPGRVIEAAIPWTWLGGYRPAVGRVIGVAVQGGDVDGPGGLRAAVQWPTRAQLPDGPYLNWGRVDKPTPFADLAFTR